MRRRRQCGSCAGRFTTFERVQLRDLEVVKKSGRRTPFDRDKLARSVLIALQKRPVEPERTEQMISGIVRQLEAGGTAEIKSDRIGERNFPIKRCGEFKRNLGPQNYPSSSEDNISS